MADVLTQYLDCESTSADDARDIQMVFHCPGCGDDHPFRIKGQGPVWEWNGSMERPTFSPSLLVWGSRPEQRCHSFVRDGRIQFLDDCWHPLKGQTFDLLPVPHAGA